MSYLFDQSVTPQVITQDAATWAEPVQRTVVFWIKLVSYGDSARGRIWSPAIDANRAAVGLAAFVDNANVALGIACISGRSTQDGYWGAANTMRTGHWIAVVITYDGASTANVPTIYTMDPDNGDLALVSRTVTEVQAPIGDEFVPDIYRIGHNDPASGSPRGFDGKIAYLQVFDGILGSTDRQSAVDAPGSVTSGRLLYQRLDNDTLADVDDDDDTATEFDATATGATLDADNPPVTLGGGGGIPFLLFQLLGQLMDTVIQKDAVNQSVEVLFLDSTTGEGLTGLVAADMDIQYFRPGAAAVAITEADLAAIGSAHSDGGVKEIGFGLYRLDLPDAVVATGVDRAKLIGSATGGVMVPLHIVLTNYDPILEGADVSALATQASVDGIAADVLDEVVEGTTTLRQSIRLANSALGGKSTNSGKTYRDLADSKDRITATVDGSKNRTAVALDLA